MRLPKHKIKIVCTIGPASRSEAVLEWLMLLGMNVADLSGPKIRIGRLLEEPLLPDGHRRLAPFPQRIEHSLRCTRATS